MIMVIYGYGLSIFEQEKREVESFKEEWERKKSRISRDIPSNDAIILRELYQRFHCSSLSQSSFSFVENIAWRIYTEWSMSPESQGKDHYNGYHGQAFTKFIDDETFYSMNRAFKSGKIQDRGNITFKEIRYKVLESIVKRAIELFRDWNGSTTPLVIEDKRNLRTDLREYIGF